MNAERLPVSAFKVGDTIQHYRKMWPAQQVTAIRPTSRSPFSGVTYYRVELSGGSGFSVSDDQRNFLKSEG